MSWTMFNCRQKMKMRMSNRKEKKKVNWMKKMIKKKRKKRKKKRKKRKNRKIANRNTGVQKITLSKKSRKVEIIKVRN